MDDEHFDTLKRRMYEKEALRRLENVVHLSRNIVKDARSDSGSSLKKWMERKEHDRI